MKRISLSLALLPACCVCSGAIPSYVLDFAPLFHLAQNESHWPSDVAEHVRHVTPKHNGTRAVADAPSPLTLDSLTHPSLDSPDVFLTSDDDFITSAHPSWLTSEYGKPDERGYSRATAFCILVDKSRVQRQIPPGDLDAYWFAFFSYSRGLAVPVLGGRELGNHVGDWEHSMVRFANGKPVGVYTSRHGGGDSFTYDAVEKRDGRPVLYIARGSHAMYAYQGEIDFSGSGFVRDTTNKGALWDPVLNVKTFRYTALPRTVTSLDEPPFSTAFLLSSIIWGDKQLPDDDPRQKGQSRFAQWASGPAGPLNKTLVRQSMGRHSTMPALTKLPNLDDAKAKSPPPSLEFKKTDKPPTVDWRRKDEL